MFTNRSAEHIDPECRPSTFAQLAISSGSGARLASDRPDLTPLVYRFYCTSGPLRIGMARKNLTPRAIEDLNRGRICDPITPGFATPRRPSLSRDGAQPQAWPSGNRGGFLGRSGVSGGSRSSPGLLEHRRKCARRRVFPEREKWTRKGAYLVCVFPIGKDCIDSVRLKSYFSRSGK